MLKDERLREILRRVSVDYLHEKAIRAVVERCAEVVMEKCGACAGQGGFGDGVTVEGGECQYCGHPMRAIRSLLGRRSMTSEERARQLRIAAAGFIVAEMYDVFEEKAADFIRAAERAARAAMKEEAAKVVRETLYGQLDAKWADCLYEKIRALKE